VIIPDVLFQGTGQLGPFRGRHGNQVLDAHGIQHLSTETLRSNTRADALSCRIDGASSACRSPADHEHVEGFTLTDFLCLTDGGTRVYLGQDFLNAHATLGERLAIL